MKRLKIKKFNTTISFIGIFLYLEIVFRLLKGINLFDLNMINIILINTSLAFLLSLLCSLANKKVNKVFYFIYLFLVSFIFGLEYMIHKIFGSYFDWSLFKAADQVAGFASDGVMFIIKNIVSIILILLPFIVLLILKKDVVVERKNILIRISGFIVFAALFLLSLNINKNEINSAKNLFYDTRNLDLSIKKLGVVPSFVIDEYRNIIGFEEKMDFVKLDSIDNNNNNNSDNTKVYAYNNLDIDFNSLIASESNSKLKQMHEYFNNENGTLQNEYTGFFKDKNLILFMAESFNEIAVREDLTPTLYKLVNNGFIFKNFYTPTIMSTIGGEYQEVTGMVAASGFISPWRNGNNYFPFGLGTMFKNANYSTFAYHNHSYSFQDRYKYLKALGFDNFTACFNGLEKKINCHQWPESDIELIDTTFLDYVDSEKPFFTYYVTVSGHGDYGWAKSAMARKNKDLVSGLSYSEKPLAYLAANIELDKALELLIKKLDEKGILDDTVIALVGDHYPYYLSLDEVNEIATYKKDDVIEINRSNFILWNNKMENVIVEKVGSQIDVLPTIYNLFNLPYDSRLIIGKDILSTEPGLAIFGNSSWVSDKGSYFASGNKFVPKEDNIDDSYVKTMNTIVKNKIIMSRNIITEDYYRKVIK